MKILEALRHVHNDRIRKPFTQIALEAAHCALLEKEIPYYYFTSLLHQEDSGDYRNYIGHKRIQKITKEFFNAGDVFSLKDKTALAKILEEHKLPTPKILAQSSALTLRHEGEVTNVSDTATLNAAISKMISKSGSDTIFVKPMDGSGGKNTFKINLATPHEEMDKVLQQMPYNSFIFQEGVVQHPDINRIYHRSINTVRVHTYRDPKNKEVSILSALMRFGSGGNIVDNGSSSGFFVPINLSSWVLTGPGKSYLHSGARTLQTHPDSGAELEGFPLPYGEEIAKLARMAAPLFEQSFIGWDIAVTDQGPLIIEGNHEPHLIMAQIASGGIRQHPGFMKVFGAFI